MRFVGAGDGTHSNLRDLAIPELILQLNVLKNHISIKSFAFLGDSFDTRG